MTTLRRKKRHVEGKETYSLVLKREKTKKEGERGGGGEKSTAHTAKKKGISFFFPTKQPNRILFSKARENADPSCKTCRHGELVEKR